MYRLGRKICTTQDSESLTVSMTVGPYLLVILLARTIGYSFSFSKELILIVLHEVATSNFLLDPSCLAERKYTLY